MEATLKQKSSEVQFLEEELGELLKTTVRLEYELELFLQEQKA